MSNELQCPKCGSTSIHTDKKGFSGKKAVAGAVLTGGVGLLAGTIGSNKIIATCLKCGNAFSPLDEIKKVQDAEKLEQQKIQIAKNKEAIKNSKVFQGIGKVIKWFFIVFGVILLISFAVAFFAK